MTMPVFVKSAFNQHLVSSVLLEVERNISDEISQPKSIFSLRCVFIGINRRMFKTENNVSA